MFVTNEDCKIGKIAGDQRVFMLSDEKNVK